MYGLPPVWVTGHELGFIRRRTLKQRQEVFRKNLRRGKTRLNCSTSEIFKINEYREQNRLRMIKFMEKTLKNEEVLASTKSAARRHGMVEDLVGKGESTRTKKALARADWRMVRDKGLLRILRDYSESYENTRRLGHMVLNSC